MQNYTKFLIKNQDPFLIPPGFTNISIKSKRGQVFRINLKKKLKNWSYIDNNNEVTNEALYFQVAKELEKYPNVICSLVKNDIPLVTTKEGMYALRCAPPLEKVLPLTRIRASLLGSVLVFKSFDYRDVYPRMIDFALTDLKKEPLDEKIPNYLCDEQKLAYSILLEEEKLRRIPPTEQKIKGILKREKASLINMKETVDGYELSFNYHGTRRNIKIKEDLMLVSSGMCLSGRDKSFSLESFLSILHSRGREDWHDDGLHI